jgi:hypothetical protein
MAWTSSGATQPPIQRVLAAVFPEVKQVGHEATHCPAFSAKIRNEEGISLILSMCVHDVHTDNFTFVLFIKLSV